MPVSVNSILQTNYVTLSFQPLTKTAFTGTLLTNSWYYVAIGFDKSSPYAYEVINTSVVKAYTDILDTDLPVSLTGDLAFGSGTLATSADFSFKHASVFRVFKESADMLL